MEGLFVLLRNLAYVLWRMETIQYKPLYWVVTGSDLHFRRISLVWGTECYQREALWGGRHVKLVRGGEGDGSLTRGTKWVGGRRGG